MNDPLYFMSNEVIVFPYVKWTQYFLELYGKIANSYFYIYLYIYIFSKSKMVDLIWRGTIAKLSSFFLNQNEKEGFL